MLSTVEVRWFHEGTIPPQVLSHFLQGDELPIAQPPRTDYYLRLPDQDNLGIKHRQGAIEVKQRTESQGLYHFNDQASGFIESWCKWRFELSPSSQAVPLHLESSKHWISIHKTRQLRRYQRQGSGEITQVPQDMESPTGCEWELSTLQVGNQGSSFWSMAFEAFDLSSSPDPARMMLTLTSVVRNVLINLDQSTYKSQASYSYPAFLHHLASH